MTNPRISHPVEDSSELLERAVVMTLVWAAVGSGAALPLLALRLPPDSVVAATIHLILLVGFSLILAARLAPLSRRAWFPRLGIRWSRLVTVVWAVVLATGATGIVALATSAALRYHPSFQFLQLLSALDIAWAGSAIIIGLRLRRGGVASTVGGLTLGLVCIWSIWRYLSVVGLGPDGAWIVDGGRLMTLVLPYDMAAAVAAATSILLGSTVVHASS